MGYIVIFIIKIIDNIIKTTKTILVQKNQAILAALTVVMSQVIFYNVIQSVVSSNSSTMMYVASVASGIGTYIAIQINKKFSKERLYVNIVFSDNREAIKEFKDYLVSKKITNNVTDSYTKDWEKTLSLTIYTQTKEESKVVEKYIKESEVKFKRIVQKLS